MALSQQSRLAQLPAHPAFPLVMALWLAALLGLGGLVAGALGQPQLGTAMLSAIALIGALAGAVLGLLIGRKVYRASKVFRANKVAPDEPAQAAQRRRTPINAHAELGEGGLDEPVEEPDDIVESSPIVLAAQEDAELDEDTLALAAEQKVAEAELETEAEAEAEAEPAPATATPASELETLPLPQLASRLQDAVAARRAQRGNGPDMQNAPGTSAAAAPIFAETPANPPAIKARPDDAQPDDAEDDAKGSDPRASAVHHPAQKPFVEAGELMADHDDEEPLEDETALGETYTSLLAMTASVRAEPEWRAEDHESQEGTIAQDPAQTLAALDRASERRPEATAPLRKLDPQDQSLRDALMNLQQFTRHS